jgi:hypothetical protein
MTRDVRSAQTAWSVSDPANLEVCVNCGRRRMVGTRSPQGPLCPGCPPLPTATCSICGQHRPCGTSRLTGLPWCPPCQNLSARCSRCDQLKPIRSGTLDQPLCQDCTAPAFPECRICETSPRPGQCVDCRLELRIRKLMTGPNGVTHPALLPLRDALAATDPPGTALRWLAKEPVAAILADIAAGRRQLTHADLDELPQRGILDHLRSVLVATGTLPARDEQMARLERFLDKVLATRTDPDQRQLLHRYTVWHLLRRLRRRNNGRATTNEQYTVVVQRVRSAVALLDWLASRDLTLTSCGQADLDHYDQALRAGWPIATGVIEGACRHLIGDRLDITGARWGLAGAESILKLRALIANADFPAYWRFRLDQEHHRVHHTRHQDERHLAA